jgi:hypothetical protein
VALKVLELSNKARLAAPGRTGSWLPRCAC